MYKLDSGFYYYSLHKNYNFSLSLGTNSSTHSKMHFKVQKSQSQTHKIQCWKLKLNSIAGFFLSFSAQKVGKISRFSSFIYSSSWTIFFFRILPKQSILKLTKKYWFWNSVLLHFQLYTLQKIFWNFFRKWFITSWTFSTRDKKNTVRIRILLTDLQTWTA